MMRWGGDPLLGVLAHNPQTSGLPGGGPHYSDIALPTQKGHEQFTKMLALNQNVGLLASPNR